MNLRTASLLLVLLFALAFGGLMSVLETPTNAQVPAYQGYPIYGGCLYVTVQGHMVIRELNAGEGRPTPEMCQ